MAVANKGGPPHQTLADLTVGQRARVESVEGVDEIGVRLMEMGLLPGVEVAVLGTAPFGDPIEIELRGYRLSLRRSEAARVRISPM